MELIFREFFNKKTHSTLAKHKTQSQDWKESGDWVAKRKENHWK